MGDPKQLPEIEADGLFAAQAPRLPTATLAGNQRQRQRWEQRALRELRDGDVMRAMSAYRRHDRLRITDTLEQLGDRIVKDYQHATTRHDPEQVLLIATSRSDARRLNAQLRQRLLADGKLGADELRISLGHPPGRRVGAASGAGALGDGRQRGYRTGEQVLVTANDYQRGLLNGSRGTVTAVDLTARTVTVRFGAGQQVRLDEPYLRQGQLADGYALTAHKAQGVTVDVALLWGTRALTRETGYVALSRGREANYLYATWDGLRYDQASDVDRPALGGQPDPPARRGPTRAALTERLAVTGRHRLARSWWRPPANPASRVLHLPAATAATPDADRAGRLEHG